MTLRTLNCCILFVVVFSTACTNEEAISVIEETPVVQKEATYNTSKIQDITYAEGLGHNASSTTPFSIPLKLDVYFPDTNTASKPVFMFIHGGGFKGGIKHKPEIVEMAEYYASRGWIFVSIDYRTTEELGSIQGKTKEEVLEYYHGIAPKEWVANALEGAENPEQVQQAIAMYTAQRDAKAALRWIVANKNTYGVNTDYISVGGASAGAITCIALGISNLEDFKGEMSWEEDPSLATTNENETYAVRSMIYFWGSTIALDVFESVYQKNRYDSNDPELFMAHGTAQDLVTPYSEALELQEIYNSLGIHHELATIETPNGTPAGHGAWNGVFNGKGLFELTFDFISERQALLVE